MPLSARSGAVPIYPSDLKGIVTQWRIGQNFQVAIVTFLVYDTLITIDKEVKYFWKIPRRPVDIVYFVNRYGGIFSAVVALLLQSFNATLSQCEFALWAHDIANWINIISIDYILMIRVLALHSNGKTISICLKVLLVLEAALKLGLIVYMEILAHVAVGMFEDISVCAETALLPWQLGMGSWLAPLFYGTLLMILALYKAVGYWRLATGFQGFTLVKVLIEDQVIYFVPVILCTVFAILEFKLELPSLLLANILNQLGSPSILSLLGSRMLLHAKEVGERGQNEGTSYLDAVPENNWDGTSNTYV